MGKNSENLHEKRSGSRLGVFFRHIFPMGKKTSLGGFSCCFCQKVSLDGHCSQPPQLGGRKEVFQAKWTTMGKSPLDLAPQTGGIYGFLCVKKQTEESLAIATFGKNYIHLQSPLSSLIPPVY